VYRDRAGERDQVHVQCRRAVTGYFIYLGTKSGKESSKPVNAEALSPSTRSYVLRGLRKSTRYYLFVRAQNAVGLGTPSNQVSAIT
jgi:hypothetical protein